MTGVVRYSLERDWVDYVVIVATMLLAIGTLVGVIASLYYSRRTIQSLQAERDFRDRPILLFSQGGHVAKVNFRDIGPGVPGVNREYAKRYFSPLPNATESVLLDSRTLGKLINFGQGPALGVKVCWTAERITIGADSFTVGPEKLNEPAYERALNTMPAVPSNIAPGDSVSLSRLPTFVVKDLERKLSIVAGRLEITAQTSNGSKYLTVQDFRIFTDYAASPPTVTVTFGDVRDTTAETAREGGLDVWRIVRGALPW